KARHVVRVTVLGSGDAFGSGGRLHSAYRVETPRHTFLRDCGPTILQSFKRSGRDPGAVDFVLLSHLHRDHFGGLPFLFIEYLFLCECCAYEPPVGIPLSYSAIAARARDLGCRRLVLSHLGSERLAHLGELTLECARDGMTLDL